MYIIATYDRHLDCTIYFVRKNGSVIHYSVDREKATRFINSVEAEEVAADLASMTLFFLEEVNR